MSASEYDVAIIGSGVGGLTCGALLAQQRKRVIILEKHISAGGYAASFKRKGFIFDAAIQPLKPPLIILVDVPAQRR